MSSAADLERQWERDLNQLGTVLAKFSAPWCAPCKAMEPSLRKLEEAAGAPPVIRVDVEAAPGLAARFGVRAMPTLMLLQDGQPLRTVVGLQTFAQLTNFVEGPQ